MVGVAVLQEGPCGHTGDTGRSFRLLRVALHFEARTQGRSLSLPQALSLSPPSLGKTVHPRKKTLLLPRSSQSLSATRHEEAP